MRRSKAVLLPVLAAFVSLSLHAPASAQTPDAVPEPGYLRLIDRLDRPDDGYCLDVLGANGTYRIDMPLTAHNCKPGRAPDGLISLRADGTLYFPAFDQCVTVMGVNRTALDGTALMLKPCGVTKAFLRAGEFQTFDLQEDGRLVLAGTDLCVTVGTRSAATFSSEHAWRALFMGVCEEVPGERVRWETAFP